MSIIYILIPVAVLLTALGIYLFFWAVKAEQFDDLEKQGMSILFDDEPVNNISKEKQEDEVENSTKQQENLK
ncbi:MAG: cbb3-type cytochrome oxidase assembly protein CcoS [Colwellia sp.]|uniref:cbb3-type cytochrome oxidase assembly protein CcoS n=1 Tax=Colwellia sp. TaxID=56799 RepID=UPI0025C26120|nr:cbb3-type cytochrome oxidase assembly protein CcoS [Colwellia sp.]NQZ27040.1 cbb3-type cytochrome oxidase assembly protein CcoS [Colwellia sp.]